jgi:hypothetical protein
MHKLGDRGVLIETCPFIGLALSEGRITVAGVHEPL